MRLKTVPLLIYSGLAASYGQPKRQTFDIVSVKPPPDHGQSYARRGCTGDRFRFSGMALTWLIRWAYDLPPTRIQGLPDWITDWVNKNDSMYEIEAKAQGPVDDLQCKAMVRSLLEDRFRMTTRRETKEMRVYALTVSSKGAKLLEVKKGTTGKGAFFNGDPLLKRVSSAVAFTDPAPPGGVSMVELTDRLSAAPVVGLPVIDKTGLKGVYSFRLDFSVREGDDRPAIAEALEEQLGLKLVPTKAPIEVLVVDHIERPKPN